MNVKQPSGIYDANTDELIISITEAEDRNLMKFTKVNFFI